jgi:RNA polymerase sigma-70 factor (ECF subfamily)
MTRTQTTILTELLVLQAQDGSGEALSQLVEIWTPILQSRSFRLTRDRDASLEVLQESWFGIAKGLCSLRDPAMFGPWALRIVHHKSADWIKLQAKQRRLKSHLRENASRSESDRNRTTDEDDGQAIRIAIGQLDRKLREIVYLFYMDNCTLEQIAVVLDIPVGTVKTRLSRARQQLKPILERNLENQLERST